MSVSGERHGNFGVALLAAVLAFITAGLMVKALTKADGLGLVWGVIVGLIVVLLARNSFYTGVLMIFSCLFLLTLYGLFNLFV